jgi:hypothetical protein
VSTTPRWRVESTGVSTEGGRVESAPALSAATGGRPGEA